MAWASGFVKFNITRQERQRRFQGDITLKRVDDLVFNGVITDADEKKAVPGALVKIFARSSNGREISLGHSYSGSDGHYLLTVNKDRIPPDTVVIFIRAVAGSY